MKKLNILLGFLSILFCVLSPLSLSAASLSAAEPGCKGAWVIVNVNVTYLKCQEEYFVVPPGTSVAVMIYDGTGRPVSDGIGIVSASGVASVYFSLCPGIYAIEVWADDTFRRFLREWEEGGLSCVVKFRQDEACDEECDEIDEINCQDWSLVSDL